MNNLSIVNEQVVLEKNFKVYGDIENPLFLAKDVAEWIDYSKTGKGAYDVSKMLKTVDDDEKTIRTIFVSEQKRDMWFVTEDGFYEILMLSRKPIAKQFKKEVKKILKELRLNGKVELADSYTITDPIKRAERWIEEQKQYQLQLQEKQEIIEAKNEIIQNQAPDVAFAKAYNGAEGYIKCSGFAKALIQVGIKYLPNNKNIGRNNLLNWLKEEKYINKRNEPYQKYIKYFGLKQNPYQNSETEEIVLGKPTLLISLDGQHYLIKKLGFTSLIEEYDKTIKSEDFNED